MTQMTPRAAARAAAGETSGAGTGVCLRCGGEKEPRRINSDRCAMCNGKSTKKEREAAGGEARGVTLSHAVRTTVSVETFGWLERTATEQGTTLAALARDLLDRERVRATGSTVPTGWMTDAELHQMKVWNKAVMIGDWAGKKPAAWRAAIDPILREQGHDLPPLPRAGDHDALIAWAHAVHRIIAPSSSVVPPRWQA